MDRFRLSLSQGVQSRQLRYAATEALTPSRRSPTALSRFRTHPPAQTHGTCLMRHLHLPSPLALRAHALPSKDTYYHEFKITLSYSIIGGGTPAAPTFTANEYGSPVHQALTTTPTGYWFDDGSIWSVTNPLSSSTPSSQRWESNQATSGRDQIRAQQYSCTTTSISSQQVIRALEELHQQAVSYSLVLSSGIRSTST